MKLESLDSTVYVGGVGGGRKGSVIIESVIMGSIAWYHTLTIHLHIFSEKKKM